MSCYSQTQMETTLFFLKQFLPKGCPIAIDSSQSLCVDSVIGSEQSIVSLSSEVVVKKLTPNKFQLVEGSSHTTVGPGSRNCNLQNLNGVASILQECGLPCSVVNSQKLATHLFSRLFFYVSVDILLLVFEYCDPEDLVKSSDSKPLLEGVYSELSSLSTPTFTMEELLRDAKEKGEPMLAHDFAQGHRIFAELAMSQIILYAHQKGKSVPFIQSLSCFISRLVKMRKRSLPTLEFSRSVSRNSLCSIDSRQSDWPEEMEWSRRSPVHNRLLQRVRQKSSGSASSQETFESSLALMPGRYGSVSSDEILQRRNLEYRR